jgi:hypothetical protein
MSELRANTISAANGTGPVTLTKQHAAKAWASVDQSSTDHPVYDSFNVSGTEDIGAGVTKITFSNVMSNTVYALTGGGQTESTSGSYFGTYGVSTSSSRQMTAAHFHTSNRNSAGNDTDMPYFAFVVHGDLG